MPPEIVFARNIRFIALNRRSKVVPTREVFDFGDAKAGMESVLYRLLELHAQLLIVAETPLEHI